MKLDEVKKILQNMESSSWNSLMVDIQFSLSTETGKIIPTEILNIALSNAVGRK